MVLRARWLAFIGDWAYRALLRVNTAWNHARRRLGLGYWSFARFLKSKVKQATRFSDAFERELANEARRRGLDGVICGHIHKAERRTIDGITYVNDGDWVESCTAAVELFDGRIELVDWAALRGPSLLEHRVPAPRGVQSPQRLTPTCARGR